MIVRLKCQDDGRPTPARSATATGVPLIFFIFLYQKREMQANIKATEKQKTGREKIINKRDYENVSPSS